MKFDLENFKKTGEISLYKPDSNGGIIVKIFDFYNKLIDINYKNIDIIIILKIF